MEEGEGEGVGGGGGGRGEGWAGKAVDRENFILCTDSLVRG